MKNLANYLTLLNLVFGCLAIVFTLQGVWQWVEDPENLAGYRLELQSEKLYLASLFIALAAVVDFLDGFVARLLGADSNMGKQLDSLADVVSFGVAPSMIVFQFLRLSLAGEEDGLSASFLWLIPAFGPAVAAAWRLARYNTDLSTPAYYFRGTPVPSAGITLASLPLIWWQAESQAEVDILTNKWILYVLIGLICFLMVSNVPMMSHKPRNKDARALLPYACVVGVACTSALFLGWWAVPVTFAAFVFFSVVFQKTITQ